MSRGNRTFQSKFNSNAESKNTVNVIIIGKDEITKKKIVYNRTNIISNTQELLDKVIERVKMIKELSETKKQNNPDNYMRGIYEYLYKITHGNDRSNIIDTTGELFVEFAKNQQFNNNHMSHVLDLEFECLIYLAFCEESEINDVVDKIKIRTNRLNYYYSKINDWIAYKNQLLDQIDNSRNELKQYERLIVENNFVLEESEKKLMNINSMSVKNQNKTDKEICEQEISNLNDLISNYENQTFDIKKNINETEPLIVNCNNEINKSTMYCFEGFEKSYFMSDFGIGELDIDMHFWVRK